MVVPTKVGLNDNLLLELIGLPHSLDRAVHQINFLFCTGSRDHSETFLLLALFYQSTPSWIKVMGGWWWVACEILLSSPGTGGTLYSHFPGPRSQVPVA